MVRITGSVALGLICSGGEFKLTKFRRFNLWQEKQI